jgi:Cu-Zn family superoxide dismutase
MQRNVLSVLGSRPQAVAFVRGSAEWPQLSGLVRFYQVRNGVPVSAEVQGLPQPSDACCGIITPTAR